MHMLSACFYACMHHRSAFILACAEVSSHVQVVVSAKDDAVAMAYDPADPHAPAGSNPGLGASGLPDGDHCALS